MAKSLKSYIICTSPRSGSTLLCKYLTATGQAGAPQSYFHKPSRAAWAGAQGLPADSPLADIVAAARHTGTAGTGLFGLRLQRPSFDFLMQQLDLLHPDLRSDTDRIQAGFGTTAYIHLTRGDKVAQAVSLIAARQTGLWHRTADGAEMERSAAPQPPRYDAQAITRTLALLTQYDRDWRLWFAQQNLKPLEIHYDALVAQPLETLTRIVRHLGLEPPHHPPTAQTAQLADHVNRAWIAQYRAAHPDA